VCVCVCVCVCVVSQAELRVLFLVCSEGPGWTFNPVSDKPFLPPFITQSSYEIISTTYVVEPKILHYSDTRKADTLGRDWYIRLRDANHTSPKQHRKKVDSLSAEDCEPAFSVCLKILHIMPWLSNLRPCRSLGGLSAQRSGFNPRAVHVGWIFDEVL